VAIVGAAAALLASYTRRVSDWIVMTDELLYAKLSLSIVDALSPLPMLRGERVSLSSQLYPLVTAPSYAAFDMPTAFHVVHLANAVIMASAAVPAYLLARTVLRWQTGAYLVAAFSVAIPWLVLAFYGLTEVAAYPAFLWAAVAVQRTIVDPSLRRDALAVAAIAVAIVARTQFFVLALVLPLGIVLHEVGYRVALAGRGRRAALADGVRAAVAAHRELALGYGVLALLAVPLAASGRLNDVLGPYAITATEGSLLPDGVWRSAAEHLAAVAIAGGLLPFALAAGWAIVSAARPANRAAHAFATLLVVSTALLTLQVGSFAVRFGEGVTRDRYVFYLAPLFFVGMLACLLEGRRRWPAVLVGTALLALLVRAADLAPPPGLWEFQAVDRPASVLNGFFTDRAVEFGASAPGLVAATAVVAGAVVAAGLAAVPRLPLAVAVGGAVVLTCAVVTRHALERLEGGISPSGRLLAGPDGDGHDWIDGALPNGARAGLVPYPIAPTWGPSAIAWWDAEFWNRTVQRAYVVAGDRFSYTPDTFPRRRLAVDFASGHVATGDEADYLVVARSDVRLRLRGRVVARRGPLELLRVERPYAAEWATTGLTLDGWTLPRTPARLRLFHAPGAGSSSQRVRIGLSAAGAAEPRRFAARSARARTSGTIAPGEAAVAELDVCLGTAFADVHLTVAPAGLVPGLPLGHGTEQQLRNAGLQLVGVETEPGRARCP
jgi:hypothetical protein